MAKKFSEFQESDGAQAGEWLVAHTELDNYKFPAKSLLSTKAVTGTFEAGAITVSPGNAGAAYVEVDTDVTSLIIEGVEENTLFPLYIKNVDSASHTITLATPGFAATVNVVSNLTLNAGATRAFMVYAEKTAEATPQFMEVSGVTDPIEFNRTYELSENTFFGKPGWAATFDEFEVVSIQYLVDRWALSWPAEGIEILAELGDEDLPTQATWPSGVVVEVAQM